MSIDFNIPKKIISINLDNKYENSEFTIIIILHNKTYNIIDNIYFGCFINPYNYDSNILCIGNWGMSIVIDNGYSDDGFEIIKNEESKYREFMTISYKLYNTIYAFFIYIKYYTIYNNIKEYYMLDTIYTYKLFNCRDLYRIVAFI